MTEAAVADLGIARLVHLEQRIRESDAEGLRERWEFGRDLISRKGEHGYLSRVADEIGVAASELRRRRLFAERCPTQAEFDHAVINFPSWHDIVNKALAPSRAADDQTPVGELPAGTFRVIVADPPWQYGNTSTRGAAEDHYPTMTLDELCALDVEGRAAPDAHLYLWATNNFLREAFTILDAWGFEYKTLLTWAKPQMGMGNYFRSVTEHVLFGVRGRLRTNARDVTNLIEAPRLQHSRKPDCFYDLVEQVSPGPYLEMFARRRRFGWESWGNEA